VSTRYVPSEKGGPTFLNIGVDYPNPSRFTVVVFGEDRDNFSEDPEDAYDGGRVCVTGLVEDYQGVTEMVLHDEDDLVVLP
jgi:DNA/RNA endonuclease YhcR with UshA esterase domain